ncbi:hypothetical protein [Desulfatibacillum aliphaticivorans]|uniref:hypothetical protein n=1 Tax=Desulfatibacillum aliphaticivorans TaxID=218208 RepID=UPI0004895D1A|nr:hypothetical protein [Desulfatibacillum aliphaticivorans]
MKFTFDYLTFNQAMDQLEIEGAYILLDLIHNGHLKAFQTGYYTESSQYGPPKRWISSPHGSMKIAFMSERGRDVNIDTIVFRRADVEAYRDKLEIDTSPLNDTERKEFVRIKRDLARIKEERRAWRGTKEAARYLTEYCNDNLDSVENWKIGKGDLKKVFREKFPYPKPKDGNKHYIDDGFEFIWECILKVARKGPGRPKAPKEINVKAE